MIFMKLNEQCFNDILLYLQKRITVNDIGLLNTVSFNQIAKDLSVKYSKGDIFYCIRKLSEANFIKADDYHNENSTIQDITYLGHQYLKSL